MMKTIITMAIVVAGAVQVQLTASTCDSLHGVTLRDTAITMASTVAAGTFQAPGLNVQAQKVFAELPAFCRVTGTIRPTPDSHIEFEVWLPETAWNGKFEAVGNGGFAGSMNYGAGGGMAGALARGYATAATDTGHKADGTDASWALGHPEKIVDFGYRANHLTAENAKSLVRAFYGTGARKAYFAGCSDGGREALMEAQRFPDDYDGIIAGAPANYWTHLLTQAIWDTQATLDQAGSYIPAAKLPAIEKAVLAACDAQDGVTDGVLDDPRRCRFDPEKLRCPGSDSDTCLTEPQVVALKKLYAGPRDKAGNQIFPGLVRGGETGGGGWGIWQTGPAPEQSLAFAFGTQFFKNMVFDNPAWDFRTLDFERDVKKADRKLAAVLNATDPDLKAFMEHGGKLILYHGWSDSGISPLNTIDYYQSVTAAMGRTGVNRFVRLFMMPGIQHCAGGPGPSLFAPHAPGDPERDLDAALNRWVERGIAPEQFIATKPKDKGSANGAQRTRPLCAYPDVAKYKGSGSTDDAANFNCVAEAR